MILKIVDNHIKKYKHFEDTDLYKLIYQSVLAGGHLISDVDKHKERLLFEINETKDNKFNNPEIIGESLYRIYLDGIKDLISHETLNKLILLTANKNKRTFKDLEETLLEVANHLNDISFYSFIEEKKKVGYPLVSHSEVYRNNYKPHYRIISKDFAFYLKLFFEIDKLLKTKSNIIIAIDGMAGSGKSTLAKIISEVYEVNLIQIDDFFLQDAQKTEKRLNEIGGNLDYERFMEEVLSNLNKTDFYYKPYNCQTKTFDNKIAVKNNLMTIIEGSYSLRPDFIKYYDLKIFLKHDELTQFKRLEKRNPKLINKFINEWLPKEKSYHEKILDENALDLIFDTTSLY